ncbi:MAG TPA: tetratricopeptide repeat protein, partial [Vicinamibacterales bacterium]|nr:tetratricopeptide repeat protein [Vicinamibacterales bacterium]
GALPESAVLPIRLLTASGPNAGGQLLTWQLVLKPVPPPAGEPGTTLVAALDAARAGHADQVRTLLTRISEEADADFLAGAGRIALLAREMPLARALFQRALERDPSSYRAALGMASTFLLQRDFDSASRAFDATRSRTHDKDEQKFLTFAIGDLATIKAR